MKFEVRKKFRFESAHRLGKGYQGKCANIHGHSWNGVLGVSTEKLDGYGMAYDFGNLKEIIKPLEDGLDHAIILGKHEEELINAMKRWGMKMVILPENPTSEAIAKYIFQQVREQLPPAVKLEYVTIKETCTSACTYSEHNEGTNGNGSGKRQKSNKGRGSKSS
ncbi:MAG: 6-carboxytetrahydropterin synthase [Sinomicrobium sp.]|nr:6-carboxytetrahydropterin synthase [Sinomicrobium sp.]